MFDIIIIGAGTAGNAIAKKLSNLNYNILVVDQNPKAIDSPNYQGVLFKYGEKVIDVMHSNKGYYKIVTEGAEYTAEDGSTGRVRKNYDGTLIINSAGADVAGIHNMISSMPLDIPSIITDPGESYVIEEVFDAENFIDVVKTSDDGLTPIKTVAERVETMVKILLYLE